MKMNMKALGILSAAHMVTDINQGALPALLPLFKEALSLSYTAAGIVILAGNLTASIIQPAFGYLSDRKPIKWFLPLGPLVACLGMSITGLAPTYFLLLTFVLLSGLGVSSFHPEGFKTAYFFTGKKKATGMSIFAVGGNLGMALGPILSLGLVTSFGLNGTLGIIAPGILMVVILLWSLTWLTAPVHSAFREKIREGGQPLSRQEWISLTLLISIVTLRSWIQMGLITYIPFYYIDYLKGNPLYAGKLVSTFLLAGAFGTLVGAPIADRWGHKNYVLVTMALMFPLLLLFFNASGPLAFVVLGVAGMVLISSFTVTTVMAQMLLPHRLGMVAGLIVGFAIGTGGVGVTLLGTIADIWGVPAAMKTILGMPLIAVGLIWLLEYPPKKAE